MLNEKFWLAVAFFSFVAFLIKYAGPAIIRTLDGKSKQIAHEILEAKEMKEKAVKLLMEAEKYYQESREYSEKLVRDAELESQKLTDSIKQTTESEVSKKMAATLDRIKTAESSAIREIKNYIVSTAVSDLNRNVLQEISDQNHAQLINRATDTFDKVTVQ
jgi:F-type H+-transporting ATPase subunit b